MAAFAAAVKIDSFAYMPVQDFGNAFSTFIAQNFGAGQYDRIRRGTRSAVAVSMLFGAAVSAVVFVLARPLMLIFVQPEETEILAVGVQYLRTEGAFYCLTALLFLLYGFYRAIERPGMSVVLTVISLGLRVVLAYALSAIPALVPAASGCPSPSAGHRRPDGLHPHGKILPHPAPEILTAGTPVVYCGKLDTTNKRTPAKRRFLLRLEVSKN